MTQPRGAEPSEPTVDPTPDEAPARVELNRAVPAGLLARVNAWMSAAWDKDVASIINNYAVALALLIGGVWTYALTKQFRDTVPKLIIKHDAASWRLHDGTLLVRIDVILANGGKVLLKCLNGELLVLRLLPETPWQRAEYAQGRILFDCRDKQGRAAKNCVAERGLNLPVGSKKAFPINGSNRTLEPGESEPYWF